MSLMLTLVMCGVSGDGGIADAYWPVTKLATQDAVPAAPAVEEKAKKMWGGFAWEGSLTAGLTMTRGNSKTTSVAVDGKAIGRGEDDRLTFTSFYRAGRQEEPSSGVEATTERRYGASAKYDYFINEKWYVYGIVSAEKDAIRTLDLLFNTGAGIGYQWIESEKRNLFTEAGLGFTSEEYEDSTANEDYLAARAAMHYDQKVSTNATFFHDSEWLPSVEDFNEDQIIKTATGIRAGITGNLAMEAKVLLDWDSSPAPGSKGTDVSYILGANWTF